jgi:diguanylate cyclase (GGDEF)-like protein/PAS domain S-box-containing protein
MTIGPHVTPLDSPPDAEDLGLLELVQDLDAIIWAFDPAADRFTFVSEHAERVLGYPRSAWTDFASWAAMIHPDDRAATASFCMAQTAAGRDHDFEYRVVARDGREVWVRDIVRLARDDAGTVVGLRGVITDITAQRVAQARLARLTESQEAFAAEQAALRRVAIEVARGTSADEIFGAVARECAGLLGVESALVARFEGREAVVVASHGGHSTLGERLPATGDGALARVATTRSSAAIADYASLPAGAPLRIHALSHGYRASVAAPVDVSGALWGAVLATTKRDDGLSPDADVRLTRFAELVALAVANAQAHTELHELATTDTLTGLANRRAFEQRLADEAARARRHGHGLSLVILDLDHFKEVNDVYGHPTGDEVLRQVAARMRALVRPGDTLARMGGEEFAWLMPDAREDAARGAAERLRHAIEAEGFARGVSITISGGVCELSRTGGPAELYRLADEALYWAKERGRNQVWRQSQVASARAGSEGRAGLGGDQSQTIRGIRALARAVDAKDPSTRLHSERVADLSVKLATALGWDIGRITSLAEAALIHDVGKIGVPDAILLNPGPLTAAEYETVKAHAVLGAQIGAEVLSPEQVSWVRHHHERWDGGGYPGGLAGAEIPVGALVIAVADAMDVMCSARIYAAPRPRAEALDEMRRERGRQFAPVVVDALLRLAATDGLGVDGAH